MKQLIVTILLFIVIICSAFYCFFYSSFNLLDHTNLVNKSLRTYALQNRFLSTMLRLHQVGDAKYEYMKQYNLPITIHIFLQQGEALEPGTMNNVLKQLQQITYKKQPITLQEAVTLIGIKDRINNLDINTILDTNEFRSSLLSPVVPLNIFVFKEYEQYPSYAGLVVDANSLILFKKIIKNVSDHQPSPEAAEVSTILHEFGHLVGAEHIPNSSCILAEKVENIDLMNRPTIFRESYCSEDISAIMKAL